MGARRERPVCSKAPAEIALAEGGGGGGGGAECKGLGVGMEDNTNGYDSNYRQDSCLTQLC